MLIQKLDLSPNIKELNKYNGAITFFVKEAFEKTGLVGYCWKETECLGSLTESILCLKYILCMLNKKVTIKDRGRFI